MSDYAEKLKDPRWQKKRLQILERDGWVCQQCGDGDSTLHVHHLSYAVVVEPWNAPEGTLITLCESCHKREGEDISDALTELLDTIRATFLSGAIFDLVTGFDFMPRKWPPPVVAAAIRDTLTDACLFDEMMRGYFARCEKLNAIRKNEALREQP